MHIEGAEVRETGQRRKRERRRGRRGYRRASPPHRALNRCAARRITGLLPLPPRTCLSPTPWKGPGDRQRRRSTKDKNGVTFDCELKQENAQGGENGHGKRTTSIAWVYSPCRTGRGRGFQERDEVTPLLISDVTVPGATLTHGGRRGQKCPRRRRGPPTA